MLEHVNVMADTRLSRLPLWELFSCFWMLSDFAFSNWWKQKEQKSIGDRLSSLGRRRDVTSNRMLRL